MTHVFAVVGADCASLAVKQSTDRRWPLRLVNQNFDDGETVNL